MTTYRKEDRLCQSCGVIFKGRRDAKYCSARCRVYASSRRKDSFLTREVEKSYHDPAKFATAFMDEDLERVPAGDE